MLPIDISVDMDVVNASKCGISFAFSKHNKPKSLGESIINDNDGDRDGEHDDDYITSVEEKELKSVKPVIEKKDLVIDLIKTNQWRTPAAKRAKSAVKSHDASTPLLTGDSVEQQAIEEILAASKQTEEEAEGTIVNAIPLLVTNQVPVGFETDEKLDVSLRPDDPELADYDKVPIEEYGLAMLRGMGWKAGEGIGKDKKVIKPIEAVARPKGLGLGATKGQMANQTKGTDKGPHTEEAPLSMDRGACCLIQSGKHKDLYGKIEALDEDNARVMVKLAVGQQVITVSQYAVKLVTKKHYEKHSKYINKAKADKYKTDAVRNHCDGPTESRNGSMRKEDKHHRHPRDEHSSSRKRRRSPSGKQAKHHSSHNGDRSSSDYWLHAYLRVRLVDKTYRKGKYYKTKVIIEDVISRGKCICRTDNGEILEDVKQSMLETVIPKDDSTPVMILGSKHTGQLAQILEKDKANCRLLVQLLSNRDEVISLHFDKLCEYTGDIGMDMDY